MLLTWKVYRLKVSRDPLLGFVSCPKILLKEEEDLPNAWTKGGFDPNAYKLMEKAGYDFSNPDALGKVVEVETYGLNKIQKRFKSKEA